MSQPLPPPTATRSTIYESLHPFVSLNSVHVADSHAFGPRADTVAQLRSLVTTIERASQALNHHLLSPWTEPKLASSLRQHSAISHTYHQTALGVQQTVQALKAHVASRQYGEDVSSLLADVPEWCVLRVETWANAAGMETYREEERDDGLPIVFGGKVLVLDINFYVAREPPTVQATSVKTSYASAVGATTIASNSVSLAGLIRDALNAFFHAALMDEDERDVLRVAQLAKRVQEHLAYLMRLDHLALAEGSTGLRWFTALDDLALQLEISASERAREVSSGLGSAEAPLDVFLNCSNGLPLPYLISPSISFLVHIPPLAYLSALRASPAPNASADQPLPSIDVPFASLRTVLASEDSSHGATFATLQLLSSAPAQFNASDILPIPEAGNTFQLPAVEAFPGMPLGPTPSWVLDFTQGGRTPGVLVSQARMRMIEGQLRTIMDVDAAGMGGFVGHVEPTWLDRLVNVPGISPDYYGALHQSPSSTHPPLQLRLQNPREAGFLLKTVPVRTNHEIWSVLRIVKEQAWLNSVLSSCRWTPEGLLPRQDTSQPEEDTSATELDLDAVLDGTIAPNKLPVSVSIVPALGPPQAGAHEALRLTVPGRGPVPGLLDIVVEPRAETKWGFKVAVQDASAGPLGPDVDVDVLEQIVRRGGVFGLAGRVWASSAIK